MKRRILISLAVLALLVWVAWLPSRVPYHRWRLAACIKTAERLRAGEQTTTDEFLNLLRGEPKTYRDYEDAAARHEAQFSDSSSDSWGRWRPALKRKPLSFSTRRSWLQR